MSNDRQKMRQKLRCNEKNKRYDYVNFLFDDYNNKIRGLFSKAATN